MSVLRCGKVNPSIPRSANFYNVRPVIGNGDGMVEEKIKELSTVLLDIIENQKMLQRELKYLKDDLRAQNRLVAETLKIHRLHQETSTKQVEMLDKISKNLE